MIYLRLRSTGSYYGQSYAATRRIGAGAGGIYVYTVLREELIDVRLPLGRLLKAAARYIRA